MNIMENMIRLSEITIENAFMIVNEKDEIVTISPLFRKQFSKYLTHNRTLQLTEVMGRPLSKKRFFFSHIFGIPCLIKLDRIKQFRVFIILIKNNDLQASEISSFISNQMKEKQSEKPHSFSFSHIIGISPTLKKMKELAARIATSSSTVLITGESGTGKELFAQAIHNLSARKTEPFVAVNCAAIPEELFESEVFGYEEGAFSGAKKEGKPGKIELAQNGTLFLDEISELPMQAQGKLLRVLQEREIERLGGIGKKYVDIRIVAATNKDLKSLVNEGRFREDLFYRLYVFDLKIPSLRERRDDILPLTFHFIEHYNDALSRNIKHIDDKLKSWLLDYNWPGNVRELKAAIERGVTLSDGPILSYDLVHITQTPSAVIEDAPGIHSQSTLEEAVQQAEKTAIQLALNRADGDRTEAAAQLNIHLASLYRKMAKYKIK